MTHRHIYRFCGFDKKETEISRQIFEIDLEVHAFKKENKDISDWLEAKCLLQQDIVSLQIDWAAEGKEQEA